MMIQSARKSLMTTLATTALGMFVFGASASATDYYSSASAPITYKMANPNMYMKYNAPQPQLAMPLQPSQDFHSQIPGLPQVTGPAATFDQSRIDRNLYANQKVGNPYTVMGQTYYPVHDPSYDMVGTASWYGDKFHGKLTANGETYDKNAMTAAHKTLPLNSFVVVTNLATGQSLTLRINDRGPFIGNRIIDLSEAAAIALGYKTAGLEEVRVQYAGPAQPIQQALVDPRNAPQYVAPVAQDRSDAMPLPSAPRQYQPLRSMPEQFAPQLPAPQAAVQPQAVPQYGVPNMPAPVMPQMALPQAPVAIPQQHAQNDFGGSDQVTTLTISGPILMAGHRSIK